MTSLRILLCSFFLVTASTASAGAERLLLWRDDAPQARWIATPLPKPMREIADVTLNGTLAEFFGWTLPRTHIDDEPGAYLVAGWEENNPVLARLVQDGLNLRRDTLGDEGFRILTHEAQGKRYLIVTANSGNGIKYGLQELLFFHTHATEEQSWVDWPMDLARTPDIAYRGIYMLPCWAAYDRKFAWKRVLDFNSELTINRVWFWLAGFRILEQYGGEYDGVDLANPWHVSQLVNYARDRGMKFYIGGGWFTWHHEKVAEGSIDRGVQYYLDLLDLLPYAEGMYLEPSGEGKDVAEAEWRPRVDALGKLIGTIHKQRPEFEFALAVGKFNSPEYRKALHALDDRHTYWWWCWGDPLADKALEAHPLMLRWHTVVRMSAFHGSTAPPQPGETRLAGIATSYDPGMGFGNPWNGWAAMGVDQPREFDPHHLPYFAHQYRFRERSWDVNQTDAEFAERLRRRLFDTDMPADAIRHYLKLSSWCFEPGKATDDGIARIATFVDAHATRGTYRNRNTLNMMRVALDGLSVHRARAKSPTR